MELIRPSAELYPAWAAAHAEWGPGLHEDGFGIGASDDVGSAAGFATWVGLLHADEDARACCYRWIVDSGDVLGGVAARWGDTEMVRRNGHVGYGVTPSARGRGVATWALGAMIGELAARGVHDLLVVCLDGNAASAATIERNGGRLEEIRVGEHARVRRYRIDAAGR